MILGSAGMAGHMVTSYFKSLSKYRIINVDLTPFDENTIILNVFNEKELILLISKERPNVVINCIGALVEASRKKPDVAIFLNSYFPHFLESLGKKLNFKLIHMSTDCVFSGDRGNYKENDFKDGIGFYAQSKSLGEIVNEKDLTFRMSIIGPEIRENGTGLFHWFMSQKEQIKGFKNVYWTGVTTLELAKAMNQAIEQNLTGLYHLVPEQKISKYDLLKLINNIWNMNIDILEDYQEENDKSLINTRTDFNFKKKSYDSMLLNLKEWMIENKSKYYNKYSFK